MIGTIEKLTKEELVERLKRADNEATKFAIEASDLRRELEELKTQLKGPEGFATWKEAAIHERLVRVETIKVAESLRLGLEAMEIEIERIRNRLHMLKK